MLSCVLHKFKIWPVVVCYLLSFPGNSILVVGGVEMGRDNISVLMEVVLVVVDVQGRQLLVLVVVQPSVIFNMSVGTL